MKKLKLLGWIYIACSLIFLVFLSFYTFIDKISLSRTLLCGIVWTDILLIALITRKDRPKDFSRTLMIALFFFMLFIVALVYEYILP